MKEPVLSGAGGGGDTCSLEVGWRAAGRTGGPPRAEGPRLGDSPSLISEEVAWGCSWGWGAADGGLGPLDLRAVATHVGVPVPEDLVEHVAELPAEDGTARQREPDGIGPEGEGPLLVVSAQDDACQVKAKCTRQGPQHERGLGGCSPAGD